MICPVRPVAEGPEIVIWKVPIRLAEQERTLSTPGQFAIDVDQNFGIEQRAVLHSPRPVDTIAIAERIETVRQAGMFFPGERQSVDNALQFDHLPTESGKFRVEKAHVEFRVVDNQRRLADEREKVINHLSKHRFVFQGVRGMAMHRDCVLRNVAFGIDELVEDPSRQDLVHDFDGADLKHTMTVGWIESCRFGIKHDFTHDGSLRPSSPAIQRRN